MCAGLVRNETYMDLIDIKPEVLVSYCALIVSGCSLLLVGIQVKLLRNQLRLDALIRLKDINRELLVLGFTHPELFEVLNGNAIDPEKEKRYLQLWLNQIDVIWHGLKSNLFTKDYEAGLRRDISDMFQLESMRKHWNIASVYYSRGFVKYINRIIDDIVKDEVRKASPRSVSPVIQKVLPTQRTAPQTVNRTTRPLKIPNHKR